MAYLEKFLAGSDKRRAELPGVVSVAAREEADHLHDHSFGSQEFQGEIQSVRKENLRVQGFQDGERRRHCIHEQVYRQVVDYHLPIAASRLDSPLFD